MRQYCSCSTLLDPHVSEIGHDQPGPFFHGSVVYEKFDDPGMIEHRLVVRASTEHVREMNTLAVRGDKGLHLHTTLLKLPRGVLLLVATRPVDENRRSIHDAEDARKIFGNVVVLNGANIRGHQGLEGHGGIAEASLNDSRNASHGNVRCGAH
jgi:hypothetical protein